VSGAITSANARPRGDFSASPKSGVGAMARPRRLFARPGFWAITKRSASTRSGLVTASWARGISEFIQPWGQARSAMVWIRGLFLSEKIVALQIPRVRGKSGYASHVFAPVPSSVMTRNATSLCQAHRSERLCSAAFLSGADRIPPTADITSVAAGVFITLSADSEGHGEVIWEDVARCSHDVSSVSFNVAIHLRRRPDPRWLMSAQAHYPCAVR